jgi:hypothetical protein
MSQGSMREFGESPIRVKERQRSRSPIGESEKQKRDRGPRIFIFHCHAVTFPGKGGRPALIDHVDVDTFTSAKFGHSFGVYMYNPHTSSFFDEPYNYFIEEVVKRTKENPDSLQKDKLREVINDSLCFNRDVTGFIFPDKCKFRCHRVGRRMTDMYMMTPGPPMDDVILSVDPLTGDKEDVHDKFGLVEVEQRLMTYPNVIKEIGQGLDVPISNAERELEYLRSQISMFSQENTSENMKKVREFQKKYDNKFLKLNLTKSALQGALQGPKYVFKPEYRDMYDYIEGIYPVIKLSDMINIAIRNRTIDPQKDFVVLQACRKFHGELPSGYDPTRSPGRADSESDSQGGGGRATSKYSRKKYGKNKDKNKGKNKNRNKNKRKTIRKLKSPKSRKRSS